jgi:hypothetical protein
MAYIGTKKVTMYYNGRQIFMPLYGDGEIIFEGSTDDNTVEKATLASVASHSLSEINGKALSEFN